MKNNNFHTYTVINDAFYKIKVTVYAGNLIIYKKGTMCSDNSRIMVKHERNQLLNVFLTDFMNPNPVNAFLYLNHTTSLFFLMFETIIC